MKFYKQLLLFCLFTSVVVISQAQDTETRNLSNFTDISFSGAGNIYLQEGNSPSIKIEAVKGIPLDEVITEVKGDKLRIYFKKDKYKNAKVNLWITYKDLEKVALVGAGNIYGENTIKVQDLALDLSGAGNIELAVDVNSLDVEISGAGNIDLSGTVDLQDLEVNGAGNIKAYALASQETKIEINGVGNAEVKVSDKLDADVSGMGKVYYKGDPNEVNINSSMSVVKKVEE